MTIKSADEIVVMISRSLSYSRQSWHRIVTRAIIFQKYQMVRLAQYLVHFIIAVFWIKPSDYFPADLLSHYDDIVIDINDDYDWPEFFHMPVLMLILITLLNDGTLIAIGYDRVIPSDTPCKWNRYALFATSSVLAGVALISSLLLLGLMLSSWQENSLFQKWGLGGLSYGQIITAILFRLSLPYRHHYEVLRQH
jgi:H+-transporting ATPase